jgi:hypothetical protein
VKVLKEILDSGTKEELKPKPASSKQSKSRGVCIKRVKSQKQKKKKPDEKR